MRHGRCLSCTRLDGRARHRPSCRPCDRPLRAARHARSSKRLRGARNPRRRMRDRPPRELHKGMETAGGTQCARTHRALRPTGQRATSAYVETTANRSLCTFDDSPPITKENAVETLPFSARRGERRDVLLQHDQTLLRTSRESHECVAERFQDLSNALRQLLALSLRRRVAPFAIDLHVKPQAAIVVDVRSPQPGPGQPARTVCEGHWSSSRSVGLFDYPSMFVA